MTRPITCRAGLMGGEACIDGTRVPTSSIGARFMDGESVAAIAADYQLDQVEVIHALRFEMNRLRESGERFEMKATLNKLEEHLIAIRNSVGCAP